MKRLVGHTNVCYWPWCGRLIRKGQHLTAQDAEACGQYVTTPSQTGALACVVNHGDFVDWEHGT